MTEDEFLGEYESAAAANDRGQLAAAIIVGPEAIRWVHWSFPRDHPAITSTDDYLRVRYALALMENARCR